MIRPGEIQKKAQGLDVRDQQIEMDYILSWILQGVAQHEDLSKAIAFKGGTVLKKIYFEDYRFSEDLDFTLTADDVSNEQIFSWFKEVFKYILDEANIPLAIVDDNEHADGGINFYTSYTGPLGGTGAHKSVKIDISRTEHLICEPVLKAAILSYSDQSEHQLLCYSLEEVLVEKLRSVIQRMQARDLYDIWYLLEIYGMDAESHSNDFKVKCECKGINPASFQSKLKQRLPQYGARWDSSIANQINDLPHFDKVTREVMRQLKKFPML